MNLNEAADTTPSDYDLSFFSGLCRDISLKRLKSHSFIDIITQGDLERNIPAAEESQWLSIIFVKNDQLRFSFKTRFVTDDVRQFAAHAYGEKLESKDLNKRKVDEFIKEFCNLMGGGIKEHFERNGLSTKISLPLLTRGQDNVFFNPDPPDHYEELFLDSWELKLGDKSIICQAIFEIYDKGSLPQICNEVINIEEEEEIEFF
jgi:hypothetical protein